jgi:hypothetical protein
VPGRFGIASREMDRFPWPLPLPGREVRLELVNPARKRFWTAAWIGGLGFLFMAIGPVRGDHGPYGAMVGLCGFTLFVLACFLGLMGLRHAFRRDVVLVIDREGVTVPRVLYFLGGLRRATWADIQGTSLQTRDGIFTGVVQAGRSQLSLGQDQLPQGWNVSELMWRIQVRALLARHDGHLDALQAAAVEALGIYGPTAEGVVVVLEPDGPAVVDLVKSPEEYVLQRASYPAEHKVIVGGEVAAAWKERASQNLLDLSVPIPPRST